MSWYHPNVVWQTADGTWSIGFHTATGFYTEPDDGEFDPEWDAEYDFDSFEWASTGHSTKEDAIRAWHGANPGTTDICPWSKGKANEDSKKYDLMVDYYFHPEKRRLAEEKEAKALRRKKRAEALAYLKSSNYALSRVNVVYSKKVGQSRTTFHSAQGMMRYEGEWLTMSVFGEKKSIRIANRVTHKLSANLESLQVIAPRRF